MADLVADNSADRAVIDGGVRFGIEEGRIENGGGEDDLVQWRVVIGVDRRRGHSPFLAIDRLIDARGLERPFKRP